MSTIANLDIAVKAKTAEFEAGMKRSRENLNQLGETSKRATDQVNVGMLTSKRFVKDFAELGDTPAKPIMGMIRAFGALPGPIGVALGAVTALKMVFDAHGESVLQSAEDTKKFGQAMEEINTFLHGDGWNQWAKGAVGAVEKAQEKLDELKSHNHDETALEHLGIVARDPTLDIEIRKLQEQQNEARKLRDVMQDLGETLDTLGQERFELKLDGAGALEVGKNLNKELDALEKAQDRVGRGSDAWKQIQNKINDDLMAIKELNAETNRHNKMLADQAAKKQAEAENKLLEQYKKVNEEAQKFADKIHEDNVTPLEKFEEHMKKVAEAFETNRISLDDLNRETNRSFQELDKATMTKGGAGSVKSVDTNLIDIRGLRGKGKETQEVHSPQLQIANQFLQTIAQQIGQIGLLD